MKKFLTLSVTGIILLALLAIPASAADAKKQTDGVRIQDGILVYSAGHYLEGQPLETGYDIFGYNYQAHLFKGYYANVYLGAAGFPPYTGDAEAYLAENPAAAGHWAWPYRDIKLNMKWNDAWLSNMDRDGDGKLDRHYGYPSYIGSGAWETNHMWGEDEGNKWYDFVKIVAVPANAFKSGGTWYTADGVEIGADIWGQFAIILEIFNDQATGDHGVLYKSLASAGFGYFQP